MTIKKLTNIILQKKKWIFLFFLLLFVAITFLFEKDYYVGDEPRYLMFADNLLHGFYSPPPPEINLWNGPGFPLLIAVTKIFHLSNTAIHLLNALWLFLSLILIYKSLKTVNHNSASLWPVVIAGLYLPVYPMLPKILTECLTWFLISLFVYLFVKWIRPQTAFKKLFIIALVLTYLMLTKVIFAYAVLSMAIISGIAYFIKRNKIIGNSFKVFALALILSIPYQYYTYQLTGQIFYWSNAGSLSLYTMSTPYPDENGSFMTPGYMAENANHREEIDSMITRLPALEMDRALKKAAIRNIKNHPGKYLKNWLSNLGRLFIGYPFLMNENSKKYQLFAIINFVLILFLLWTFSVSLKNTVEVDLRLKILAVFFLIYLGGSSLVSAFPRMFYITLPFWLIWAGHVLSQRRNA